MIIIILYCILNNKLFQTKFTTIIYLSVVCFCKEKWFFFFLKVLISSWLVVENNSRHGTSSPPWCRSSECFLFPVTWHDSCIHVSKTKSRLLKSSWAGDLLTVQIPTAYLSSAFVTSLLQSSISPIAGVHTVWYMWCPLIQEATSNVNAVPLAMLLCQVRAIII